MLLEARVIAGWCVTRWRVESDIDLFTSPNLLECHLFGNEEERRFLGGVFRRISIPEVEFAISCQHMDDTTRDIEDPWLLEKLLCAVGCGIAAVESNYEKS